MRFFQWMLFFVWYSQSYGSNHDSLYDHQIWSIENGGTKHVSTILELQHDAAIDLLDHSKETIHFRVFPLHVEDVKQKLNENKINFITEVENIQDYLQNMNKSSMLTRESCTLNNCPTPFSNSYMALNQIVHYLRGLSKRESGKMSLISLGKTQGGLPIYIVHIKCTSSGTNMKKIWIEGGIHAREWISPAVTLHIIKRLLLTPAMTKGVEYYIVPVANPDGYAKTRRTDRFWRKNTAKNANSECIGVDLNRNWAYKWGVGASNNPCSSVYKGKNPFSERETIALMTKMFSIKQLSMFLSIHSYSQLLLYPWGWTHAAAPFAIQMKTMGNTFKDAAYKVNKKIYAVGPTSGGFYLASGTTDDWAKGVLKVKYSYTLELRDKGTYGFLLPPSQIVPNVNEVWAGFKAMIAKLKLE